MRRLAALGYALFAWGVFKLGRRMGRFEPNRYRREIAANSDYRKFDDGLMVTADCRQSTIDALRAMLDKTAATGTVRYGMHLQDEALVTCVAPSVMTSDHVHFIDGADGGYASTARQLTD